MCRLEARSDEEATSWQPLANPFLEPDIPSPRSPIQVRKLRRFWI